jgi:cysteine synthase B
MERFVTPVEGIYPTIEDTVGGTPLVRLQRIPGETTNTILGKLEGNNPAGSVKDRPAMNMIREAENRGAISPGPRSLRRPVVTPE